MKKFTIFITTLLLYVTAIFAQAPQKFSYQAVVRNASNALVTNAPVGVRISVLQGGVAGTLAYMETHTAVTNENGLMTLSIGSGNLMQGDFASIDWANGLYYLKSEIDPTGGTNYSITSIQQLLSVPYALYANESGNGFSGDYNDLLNTPTIPSVPTNVSAFANDAGYLTSFTEQQVLSISHDTVFLTGGSFVKLPAGFDGDYNSLINRPTLFSGNYNDLSNTPAIPTVPTNVSAFNNDAGYITGYTETDPQFNAWDKDYNDLINKPYIPNVPTNVSSFNNDAGYLTGYTETDPQFNAWDKNYYDLTNRPQIPQIPTNISTFTNDIGYITNADVPTNVSAFTNDAGYITNVDVPTNVSAFTNDAGYITGYTEADPQFNAWDKDYNDLINKPVIPTVPANVSAFTNDAGYITGYTEADPQFNAWDKDYNDLTNKPTIPTVPTNVSAFANDAGYITSSQVPAQVNADWNATNGAAQILNKPTLFSGNYNDLTNKPIIPTVPTNVSAFTNDAGYLTGFTETDPLFNAWNKNYNDLINKPVIPTVPTNVSAFANDAGYITSSQVPAQVNADWNATNGAAQIMNKPTLFSGNYNDLTNKPTIPTVPTNVSAFNNDAGYITNANVPTVPANLSAFNNDVGYVTSVQIPAQVNADWNATTGAAKILNKPTIPTVPVNVSAFANDAGYITSANVPTNVSAFTNDAGYITTVDVQQAANIPTNVSAFNNDANYITAADIPAQVNADWNATSGAAKILNKPTLFSGNYNDLTNKPTIPAAANNATLNIQRNGTSVGTFTANASTNKTINITVPTTTNELTNNSGFITANQIPAQVNADWNATSGAAQILNKPTIPSIPTNVSVFNNDANYITNTGNTCDNTIDLCNLLSTIESLQNQVQELASMTGGNPYGTASSDTCPQRMVVIDGSPNVCYFGPEFANTQLTVWVDGGYDFTADYIWFESGQYRPNVLGSGNSYVETWTPTYNNPLQFTVKVTFADGCSYISAPFEVNVYDKPYATVTGSAGEVCAGEEVTLRANLQNYNDPMITFQWYENQVNNSHLLSGRTHEVEHFEPASTTDYIVKVTHLMNYFSDNCVAYDTFRVEVTECDTAGGSGADTTQTSQHTISISLTTDDYGSETTWQVIDVSDNSVLASGGSYSSNNTQDIPDVIVDGTGCYVFTIYDSYGDGIYSSGNYSVSYDSVVMGSGGGNSFSQESYILNPESSSCPTDEIALTSVDINDNQLQNNNFYVKGTVTNKGVSSIHSFKVKYRVDGGAWSSDYTVSCNIAPMDTMGFTHDVPASISSTGQHTLEVVVFEPNGMADNETDNTASKNLIIYSVPEGDAQPCPGAPTVTDVDGNVYNTVRIGGQCWMRENLKVTRFPDETDIFYNATTNSTTPGRYYPYNDSANVSIYGYLYNWAAIMHGIPSSGNTPSGVQGICPDGWHVPSDGEWMQLIDYISGQNVYRCNGDIAKSLAATTGWISTPNQCCVGYEPNTNNSTGFNALPAGGSYSSEGWEAIFGSATESSSANMWTYDLSFQGRDFSRYSRTKIYGYSIRCLKDGDGSSLLPTVTTNEVNNITATTAMSGGNVIFEGESSITARGVCWSISHNPNVLTAPHTTDGNGIGSFSSSITGLASNFTYYVRAYATNMYGTVYGNEVSISIPVNPNGDEKSCPGTPTVTDIDGNVYNTIHIGGQCWMRENLKSTKYADGTVVALGVSSSATIPYRKYPYNDSTYVSVYGYLYNWPAAMRGASSSDGTPSGVQGICPSGWHLPSDAEWTQLADYVSSQSEYLCGYGSTRIAKALAAATEWSEGWNYCAVGSNVNDNNATGFGGLPAGNGSSNYGENAYFLSSTEASDGSVWVRNLDHHHATFDRTDIFSYKYSYNSVRCLRDESNSLLPSVSTGSVNIMTSTNVICSGNVTSEGGNAVTACGICWSTLHNPKVEDNHTSENASVGSFSSSITGLVSNLTYYIRAYATNSFGTVYGEEVSFSIPISTGGDEKSCPGTPTVTDVDGNIYNTILIGDQCWMRENLKTTRFANGTLIYKGSPNIVSSSPLRYYPGDASENVINYGYLYNWSAVMHNASSNNAISSGVQGICPNGWHVPSSAEWAALVDYVGGQAQYWCNSNANSVAKALASSIGWNSSTGLCHVGNDQNANNVTGFGAMPAGEEVWGTGNNAYFWSATEASNSSAWYYRLGANSDSISVASGDNKNGYSVRCLRD